MFMLRLLRSSTLVLLPVLLCPVVSAAEIPPADANAIHNSLLETKAAYEQTIASLGQQDAYNPELAQAYMALGTTLQALDDHEAALAVLGKSLQSLRSSYGLNSLQQLPVLEAMLTSNQALEKWPDVDTLLHVRYHIATRQLVAGDDTRHDALLQLGRWKLHAAANGLLPERDQPLKTAIGLYQSEINHLKAGDSSRGKSLQLATLYLDLAGAELVEAREVFEEPLRNYDSNGQPMSVPQIQCELGRDAAGRQIRVCNAVEVPNNNYYVGKTNSKNMVISLHMNVMRDAVKQALTSLQQEQANTPKRKELLAQTDKLVLDYNNFMTMMAETINPKVGSRTTR